MPLITFKKQKPLGNSLEDFIITVSDWKENPKRLFSFCVVQVYCPEETAYQVIKFDSAHGNCHVHRYYKKLDDKGEKIERGVSPESFNEFRNDLKENWRKYRQWYAEKWLSGP